MATYVPNATQATEPVESRTVESAALEFRTLKERVNTLADTVEAGDVQDLRVPETSVQSLPSIAGRAGKVLGFDAGGNPTMVSVAGAEDPSLRADLAASGGAALVGYMPAGAGAVATTVQSKLREMVSVFDFMTAAQIADVQAGTASIDVSAAVQAAINTQKAVYFPRGTYLCNSTININYVHARLYGEDQYSTVIKGSVDGTYTILRIGAAGGTWGQYGNVTLENLRIDGNRNVGAANVASKGIETLWAAHIRMNNVRVTNTRGYGVEFYTGGYSSITNCNLTGHGITGLYLNGVNASDSVTSTLVESCQISRNGTYGVHAKDFFNITLDSNIIEDIGTDGAGAAIKLEGAALRNMSILHNYLEANNDAAYDIDASGIGIQGLSIQDNWLAGTPATGTYNFSGSTLVNAAIQGNEGGDPVATALPDVGGLRSLELLGTSKVVTSNELVSSTTGGFNTDLCSVQLTAGTWIIQGVMQTTDAGGCTSVGVGIAFSNAAGQPGRKVATSVDFSGASDYTESLTAGDQARVQFTTFVSATGIGNYYMAAYINISAGAIAYKGQLRAIRIA